MASRLIVGMTAEEGRDPLSWPFASTSIWNMPIGTGADYVSADLPDVPGGDKWSPMPGLDAEHLLLDPDAPLTKLYHNGVGWDGGDRCTPDSDILATVPVPDDHTVPNNNDGAVFLLSDPHDPAKSALYPMRSRRTGHKPEYFPRTRSLRRRYLRCARWLRPLLARRLSPPRRASPRPAGPTPCAQAQRLRAAGVLQMPNEGPMLDLARQQGRQLCGRQLRSRQRQPKLPYGATAWRCPTVRSICLNGAFVLSNWVDSSAWHGTTSHEICGRPANNAPRRASYPYCFQSGSVRPSQTSSRAGRAPLRNAFAP